MMFSDHPPRVYHFGGSSVRALKKANKSDLVVLVRGGTYQLDETVVFAPPQSRPSLRRFGEERGRTNAPISTP
jgi:hypothetical protein